MKKASRKLVLRSETLRTLANMELARAVGGVEAVAVDSGRIQCPALQAVATAACG